MRVGEPPVAVIAERLPRVRERPARSSVERAAAALLLAFAALAALVATGAADPVDRYAVRHLMPGLSASAWNTNRIVNRASDLLTRPARLDGALVLFGAALFTARRRVSVGPWAAAFVCGLGFELLGKALIHRPRLTTSATSGSLPLPKFDGSFPSGHAFRAVLLAVLLAAAFPKLRPLVGAWLAAVLILLVAAGTHTPSDVAGGVVLASALALLCNRSVRSSTETLSR